MYCYIVFRDLINFLRYDYFFGLIRNSSKFIFYLCLSIRFRCCLFSFILILIHLEISLRSLFQIETEL